MARRHDQHVYVEAERAFKEHSSIFDECTKFPGNGGMR